MYALVEAFGAIHVGNGQVIPDFFAHAIFPDLDACTLAKSIALAIQEKIKLSCIPIGSIGM